MAGVAQGYQHLLTIDNLLFSAWGKIWTGPFFGPFFGLFFGPLLGPFYRGEAHY